MMRWMLPLFVIGCSTGGAGRKLVRDAQPAAGSPTDIAAPGQTPCQAATKVWPTLPELDRTIGQQMAAGDLPGLAACIVKDGDVVWCGGYGTTSLTDGRPVTVDTPFLWASVSKLVTATAVGMLAERGELSLHDPVSAQMAFDIKHPDAPKRDITAHALLAHAGGVADDWDVIETYETHGRDPVRSLEEVSLDYFTPAGADYSARWNFLGGGPENRVVYANMGYVALGHQVEAATGEGFVEWTATEIFESLGMAHTGWLLSDFDGVPLAEPVMWRGGRQVGRGHVQWADYPNGGLRAGARDMGCFLAMASRGGHLYGTEVISTDTLVDMMAPAYPQLDPDQGLGWYYEDMFEDELWVGHSGAEDGVAADLFMRQDGSLGFVLVTNGEWRSARQIEAIERALIQTARGL